MVVLHVLFEHAVGYSLYRIKEFEDVGNMMPQVEQAVNDSVKFMKAVQMVAFKGFESAAESLNNTNAVSEGIMTETLENFLVASGFTSGSTMGTLGVGCSMLGQAIKEGLGVTVLHTGIVPEVVRGIRQFLPSYIKGLSFAGMKQAELGLGHSYSRSKVKFNVNRVDNMIIQSIAINDQMDKDINTFAMRMREWYSYHFPELTRVVDDHYQYARLVKAIGDRSLITDEHLEQILEIVQDDHKAEEIMNAARMSMGTDINSSDLDNILMFTNNVINLTTYRRNMTGYLSKTMNNVAPNLGTVIGDQVAARLISQAGSLTKLAKLPASTVQILGAEKALFRALKTKGNTPKYGLIFNSTFIGRANTADKGRISRFLANKCSIASRIDCFSETLTSTFGEVLKGQVEERLKFYETGDIPRKNLEVMAEAQEAHASSAKKLEKAARKRKREQDKEAGITNGENGHDETMENGQEDAPAEKKAKKKKKDKKEKKGNATVSCVEELKVDLEEMEEEAADQSITKKKKKKNKNRESI